MSARRPPLNRGQSMPIYFPNDQSASLDSTLSSFASLNLSDSKPQTSGTATLVASNRPRPSLPSFISSQSTRSPPEMARRATTSGEATVRTPLTAPSHSSYSSHYPTPPSSGSQGHHHPSVASYFPPQPSYTSISSRTKQSANSSVPASNTGPSAYRAQPSMPLITSPASHSTNLLLSRPGSQARSAVSMTIENTSTHYILVAPLGAGFSADGITVAARKENVIVIIADRWDQEDCHHEWQVQFGRDGDMSSIHASFDNGVLKITVRRFNLPGT